MTPHPSEDPLLQIKSFPQSFSQTVQVDSPILLRVQLYAAPSYSSLTLYRWRHETAARNAQQGKRNSNQERNKSQIAPLLYISD